MLNGDLIEKYQRMSCEEKGAATKKAIHLNLPPLNLLFAVMMIWEPENVEETYKQMLSETV
jgi:hypothetical protein